MPAITLPDLNNAKLDVDHIASIATSTELTTTDRLGQTKKTLKGQMAAVDAELTIKLDNAQSQINVKIGEAAGHAADSAASAAEAFGYLQAYRATSYGALAEDPIVDPLGNPPTEGDEYFNTSAKLLKRWNSTTWQASDINTANLAAPSGASLVGYDGGTVQDVLDGAVSKADYVELRAYTGRATRIYITGLLVTAKPAGIAGVFQYDQTDTTSADNGGTIIVGADGRRWKRDNDNKFEIQAAWFGVVADGSTVVTSNIQAAFTFASASIFSSPPVGGISYVHGNTFTGICPRLIFPKGVIVVDGKMTFSGAYPDIDGSECVVKCTDTFPSSDVVFDFTNAWQVNIKGFRFYNSKNAFRMFNANLAMGMLKISDVHMQGGDVFLRLYARSSLTVVENCRLDAVKHPLIIPGDAGANSGADVVKFVDSWIVPGVLSTAYDGFFKIEANTYAPKLILQNIFYNPIPQTANDVVIVRVDGIATVDIDTCLFGGEAGQVPLVGWHATNGAIGTTRGGVIRIKDISHYLLPSSQAPTLNPSGKRSSVELFSLPNMVSFENIIGTSDNTSEGLINFRSDERTFEEALAINNSLAIHFLGHTGNGTTYMTRSAFNKLGSFVKTAPKKYFGYLTGIDNSAVASAAKLISLPEPERTRHKRFRISVAQTDGGNETYSEYIVTCDYYGNFTGYVAIKEGTQTTAPRIFIDSNNLYVRTNTATSATWSFYYEITQVAANFQGYA